MKIKIIYSVLIIFITLFYLSACKKKKDLKIIQKINDKEILFSKPIENKLNNITIFVHGTHGKFCNSLFSKLAAAPKYALTNIADLNSRHYMCNIAKILSDKDELGFPLNNFYVFGWSGEWSFRQREEAGKFLYKEIEKLVNNYKQKNVIPKITIITHSHGGNVALNLAKFKNQNNQFDIDRLILLACPVQEATKNFIKDSLFRKVYSIYATLDKLQILDPQGLHKVNRDKKDVPFFSKRTFDLSDNLRQAKIKINDRSLFHMEFIINRFLKFLPKLIKQMDNLDKSNYLIKLYTKDDNLKIIKITSI